MHTSLYKQLFPGIDPELLNILDLIFHTDGFRQGVLMSEPYRLTELTPGVSTKSGMPGLALNYV